MSLENCPDDQNLPLWPFQNETQGKKIVLRYWDAYYDPAEERHVLELRCDLSRNHLRIIIRAMRNLTLLFQLFSKIVARTRFWSHKLPCADLEISTWNHLGKRYNRQSCFCANYWEILFSRAVDCSLPVEALIVFPADMHRGRTAMYRREGLRFGLGW
jgi:hypothetical protein